MSECAPETVATGPTMTALPSRVLVMWQVENAIGAVALGVAAAVASATSLVPDAWSSWVPRVVIAGLVLAVVDAVVVIPRRHRHYRYAVTADALVIEQGKILRRRRVHPLSRILYTETRQGPLLALFDLYVVRVATIIDGKPIGPLTKGAAERVEHAVREPAVREPAMGEPAMGDTTA